MPRVKSMDPFPEATRALADDVARLAGKLCVGLRCKNPVGTHHLCVCVACMELREVQKGLETAVANYLRTA